MEIVTRRLVDDMERERGTQVEADAGTIKFGIDDEHFEIDLCSKNATRLRAMYEEFKPFARKIDAGVKAKPPRPRRTGNGLDKMQSLAVRNWARRNGRHLADRGPIPAEVLEDFEKAGGLSLIVADSESA